MKQSKQKYRTDSISKVKIWREVIKEDKPKENDSCKEAVSQPVIIESSVENTIEGIPKTTTAKEILMDDSKIHESGVILKKKEMNFKSPVHCLIQKSLAIQDKGNNHAGITKVKKKRDRQSKAFLLKELANLGPLQQLPPKQRSNGMELEGNICSIADKGNLKLNTADGDASPSVL